MGIYFLGISHFLFWFYFTSLTEMYVQTTEYLKAISDIFYGNLIWLSWNPQSQQFTSFAWILFQIVSDFLLKEGFYLNFSSNLRNTNSMQIRNPLFSWKNIRILVGWSLFIQFFIQSEKMISSRNTTLKSSLEL